MSSVWPSYCWAAPFKRKTKPPPVGLPQPGLACGEEAAGADFKDLEKPRRSGEALPRLRRAGRSAIHTARAQAWSRREPGRQWPSTGKSGRSRATAASKRRCRGKLSLVTIAALPCSCCGTLPHTRGMAPASLPSGRVLVAIEAIIAIASTAATPDIAPAASRRWCAGVDHRRGNASRGPVRGKCAARVGGLYPISATGRCEARVPKFRFRICPEAGLVQLQVEFRP